MIKFFVADLEDTKLVVLFGAVVSLLNRANQEKWDCLTLILDVIRTIIDKGTYVLMTIDIRRYM